MLERKAGVHAGMNFLANECGYQAAPVEPADEAADLMRKYVESAKVMARIAERIETLGQPLRAVK